MGGKRKGIGLIITSSMFFALMSVFVRLAGPLPLVQKTLFRNGITALIALGMLLAKRIPIMVTREDWLPLVGRILCGTAGVYCNYYAIDHLILASANSLNKLSPYFAIAFAALFLKERMTRQQLLCVLVALAGSMFLVIPNLETVGFASLVALAGGMVSGAAHVSLRALQKRGNVDSTVIVFVFCAFSTTLNVVPCAVHWEPMTVSQMLCMICAGLSCTAAQFALTGAYKYAPPKDISIFDVSQILFSALFGFVFFGQIPEFTSYIAYSLIMLASVMLFVAYRMERKTA